MGCHLLGESALMVKVQCTNKKVNGFNSLSVKMFKPGENLCTHILFFFIRTKEKTIALLACRFYINIAL